MEKWMRVKDGMINVIGARRIYLGSMDKKSVMIGHGDLREHDMVLATFESEDEAREYLGVLLPNDSDKKENDKED